MKPSYMDARSDYHNPRIYDTAVKRMQVCTGSQRVSTS